MLRNTYVHIPRVSIGTEEKIWSSGVTSWEEFLVADNLPLSESRKREIDLYVKKSIRAYSEGDYEFFLQGLPNNQHFRAFPALRNKCCYLDIETTGLSKHHHDVTVVGIYDGKKSKLFVQGKNLEDFKKEIEKYDVLVTFNGRCFDVPFLKAKFPSVNFDKFHIDLRFVMKSLGYTGGLKNVEKDIGIVRDDDLQEVDGYEAVRLWKRYQKGDSSALDLLVKYNIADIENLKVLMDFAMKRLS